MFVLVALVVLRAVILGLSRLRRRTMLAAAVVVALQVDPNRWSVLWYIIGFGFSVPIAMVRSQSAFACFGIIASSISYVLACIFPAYIPPMLGNLAIKILL